MGSMILRWLFVVIFTAALLAAVVWGVSMEKACRDSGGTLVITTCVATVEVHGEVE